MRRYGDALAMDVGILLTTSDLEIETMSYHRIIPRDLFNEASLLKCYGQIYLELEKLPADIASFEAYSTEMHGFVVDQDESDGSLTISNVHLVVRDRSCSLSRPLNSRSPYPLYLTTEDDDVIAVFTDEGHFTDEMLAFILGISDV